MPALFAYLLVVGLLLGGGYGAMSWLAEPAPIKVAVKTRPKPPSPMHYTANYKADPEPATAPSPASGDSRTEPATQGTSDGDRAGAVSKDPPAPTRSEQDAAASGPLTRTRAAQASVSAPAQQDQPSSSVKAEASPVDAKPEIKEAKVEENKQLHPVEARRTTGDTETTADAAPAKAASHTRQRQARRHPAQAGHSSEKRGLALMTLRTIEYPDGRRVSQLIPYRGDSHALASGPDE